MDAGIEMVPRPFLRGGRAVGRGWMFPRLWLGAFPMIIGFGRIGGMERLNDVGIAAAMTAFHKGPPGVVRRVAQNDSTPPEYAPIPTTYNDERAAISDAIKAYVECMEKDGLFKVQS